MTTTQRTTGQITADDRQTAALRKASGDWKYAGGHKSLLHDLCWIMGDADEGGIDVRLRYHDGQFSLLSGDSSYDQDHHGHWGCSSVTDDMDADTLSGIAIDLHDQVLDDLIESL